MKSDERLLLISLAQKAGAYNHLCPSEPVIVLMRELGISEKRASYICEKWADKDWYEYGVNVLYGWLTPEGIEAAALENKCKK